MASGSMHVGLLDRAKWWTAVETRTALTGEETIAAERQRTPERSMEVAQHSLLLS